MKRGEFRWDRVGEAFTLLFAFAVKTVFFLALIVLQIGLPITWGWPGWVGFTAVMIELAVFIVWEIGRPDPSELSGERRRPRRARPVSHGDES